MMKTFTAEISTLSFISNEIFIRFIIFQEYSVFLYAQINTFFLQQNKDRISFIHIDIDRTLIRAKHVFVGISLQPIMSNTIHKRHALFRILLQELQERKMSINDEVNAEWPYSIDESSC